MKFIFIFILFSFTVLSAESGNEQSTSHAQKKSLLELKEEILKINNPFFKDENSSNKNEVYFYIGISSFAGFLAAITLFKQEIFTEVPLAFFTIGVIFTILGSN